MNYFYKFVFLIIFIGSNASAEMIIKDNFSSKKLIGYDKSHIAKNENDFKSYEFIEQKNGNIFVRLSSRVGQLSKFNKGQKKYIKDRIELGTKDSMIPNSWKKIENTTYSWTFDAKLPKGMFETKANHITITQLKTIEKNNKKSSAILECHLELIIIINKLGLLLLMVLILN